MSSATLGSRSLRSSDGGNPKPSAVTSSRACAPTHAAAVPRAGTQSRRQKSRPRATAHGRRARARVRHRQPMRAAQAVAARRDATAPGPAAAASRWGRQPAAARLMDAHEMGGSRPSPA
eukprot:230037-Chlamydomonas_euryale.AAC.1